MKELVAIQSELKAPKSQYNSFGGYKYRNAEDILEAVKPILKKHGCVLTISDEIVMVGERFYVKATATITNSEGLQVTTTAYAREEESKRGMDASQLTGSTSSYARKYALNGLFCIDDTKDADATNTHGKEEQGIPKAKVSTYKTKAKAPAKKAIDEELNRAVKAIGECNNKQDLLDVWNGFPSLHGVQEFKKLMSSAKEKVA